MGAADVLCLQEVSVNMLLPDGSHDDQVNSLNKLFPDYEGFFSAAIDRLSPHSNEREQYGNLILSKLPVNSVFHHPLPQPAHAGVKQMPRILTQVNVSTSTQSLRIMSTHLAYHSKPQRLAQSQRILDIHDEVLALSAAPPLLTEDGPYSQLERQTSCVICGDFNFLSSSEEYKLFTQNSNNNLRLLDAWQQQHPNDPQPPTCGIYDAEQWEEGPHCRDFMFISPDLGEQIADVCVNTQTNASDHQPLKIEFSI